MYRPTLDRWDLSVDPFVELQKLSRDMNRWFSGTLGMAQAFPSLNAYTNAEQAVVVAEVPGVDPSTLGVTVNGDVLTIEGERKADEALEGATAHRRERGVGRFTRSVRLPYEVESDHVQAKLENGLLRITLPRKESSKPRRIQIGATT